jgi:hypothetical protein
MSSIVVRCYEISQSMAAKGGKRGCQCSNRSAPAEDGRWQWQWSQQVPIIGKERLTFSGALYRYQPTSVIPAPLQKVQGSYRYLGRMLIPTTSAGTRPEPPQIYVGKQCGEEDA